MPLVVLIAELIFSAASKGVEQEQKQQGRRQTIAKSHVGAAFVPDLLASRSARPRMTTETQAGNEKATEGGWCFSSPKIRAAGEWGV